MGGQSPHLQPSSLTDLTRPPGPRPCSKDEERGPQAVPPGVHGLTNGHIDAHDVHWPKASSGVWERRWCGVRITELRFS